MSNLKVHALRLMPGEDPRAKLESFVIEKNIRAAIILSAVGSLGTAVIRFADAPSGAVVNGPFEIVSFSGTLSSVGGSHLHISLSDKTGKTIGGHLVLGSKVHTTLEIALGEITDLEFNREFDSVSGYKELKITPRT